MQHGFHAYKSKSNAIYSPVLISRTLIIFLYQIIQGDGIGVGRFRILGGWGGMLRILGGGGGGGQGGGARGAKFRAGT